MPKTLLKLFLFLFLPLSVFSKDLTPEAKTVLYRYALSYLEEGNYIGALELFHFLGDFRDAPLLYRKTARFFSPPKVKALKREPLIRVAIGSFSEFELKCPQRVEKVFFRTPQGESFRKLLYKGKVYQSLTFTPKGGCDIYLNGVRYGPLPKGAKVELLLYRGGSVVVLELPLEFYLKGVLPSEVYISWPLEALKAQAVASRTYALFNLLKARQEGKPFDVGSTTAYQVFKLPEKINPKVAKAVDQTRGEVITYKGEVIYAMFSSNSGGCTHSFREITGLDLPYLEQTKEFCKDKTLKWNHWNRRVPKRRIDLLLRHLVGFFRVEDLSVKRNSCGRGLKITFTSRRGDTLTLPLSVFFRTEAKLPSDWFFVIGKSGRFFLFSGRGFGHGLGMSQWGAFCLSKRGWDYRKILKFYYRGTEIRRFYP